MLGGLIMAELPLTKKLRTSAISSHSKIDRANLKNMQLLRIDDMRDLASAEPTRKDKKAIPKGLVPWKKGNPGGPGRPRLSQDEKDERAEQRKAALELMTLAQAQAEICVGSLLDVMLDKRVDARARVAAASELLDRGFGKARQSIDLNATMSLSQEFEKFIRSFAPNDDAKIIDAVTNHHKGDERGKDPFLLQEE